MPAPKETTATFESALEKLESIVHSMESGQLPLEELLTRYEEGTQWIRFCIEVITRSASGNTQLADFEPEPTARKNTPTPAPTPSEPDDLLLS
jgi:exodeoxyribonuclease VII small subunit